MGSLRLDCDDKDASLAAKGKQLRLSLKVNAEKESGEDRLHRTESLDAHVLFGRAAFFASIQLAFCINYKMKVNLNRKHTKTPHNCVDFLSIRELVN